MKSSFKRQAIQQSNIPMKHIYAEINLWKGDEGIGEKVVDLLYKEEFYSAFIGDYNTGKTYMASALAKDFIYDKRMVTFRDFKELMDSFEKDRFKIQNPIFSEMQMYDLLIIDGISLEVWNAFSEWAKVTFSQLIKIAIDRTKLNIILTVDTSMDYSKKGELIEDFGEHFGKTLMGNFTPLFFKGE